jgi:formylglycine-generating enzyme required for sulfatase activity
MTDCLAVGGGTESCCSSPAVDGGVYDRTYDTFGVDAATDPAQVSSFRLDTYLVTVGRFRRFTVALASVAADAGVAALVPAGSGKHKHLNFGNGLVAVGGDAGSGFEQGWSSSWDAFVDPTDANLECGAPGTTSTWTSAAGSQEDLPINCVNWYEAYAFCIWDGGFLPSEAEWEYAAAGGSQQREYPWGSTDPATSVNEYAIYGCQYPSGSGTCPPVSGANIAKVGTAQLGVGRWGQLDMAGELWEWNLDWYAASYVDPCIDCAYLSTTTDGRGLRGGDFYTQSYYTMSLLSSDRNSNTPTVRSNAFGFRCARSP